MLTLDDVRNGIVVLGLDAVAQAVEGKPFPPLQILLTTLGMVAWVVTCPVACCVLLDR